MKKPCTIFDIDDTLYLERNYVKSGFETVGQWLLDQQHIDGFAQMAWQHFENGARGNIFNIALQSLGVGHAENLVPTLVNVYREHAPAIQLLEDARAALVRAAQLGRVAVITDGPESSQANKAAALGLARFCQPIILTARLGEGFGKPHPRAFETVQEVCNAAPEHCTYIADNPKKDFIAPKALGWRTVRVRRPGGLHVELDSGADVDVEIADLSSWDGG